MALDGIVLRSIRKELYDNTVSGRIDKISMPEKDEIILSVRAFGKSRKILISASSSNPRILFSDVQKENPAQPYMFLMVLRKHIAGAKIVDITTSDYDRILTITVESLNELGDLSQKHLIVEIMGKHSNIILVNNEGIILDSIKRINHSVSRVREVLPNKIYEKPLTNGKISPEDVPYDIFYQKIKEDSKLNLYSFLLNSYNGISPSLSNEICFRSNLDTSLFLGELNDDDIKKLYDVFTDIFTNIKNENFIPNVVYDDKYILRDFSVIELTFMCSPYKKYFDSPSEMIEFFYFEKDSAERINQKSADIRKVLQANTQRIAKKIDILAKSIKDSENLDKFKRKGELITSYIYMIEKGMTELEVNDFYEEDSSLVKISLNENLTPAENASVYFKKYNKKKSTLLHANKLLKENQKDLAYIESILYQLHAQSSLDDIEEIREELIDCGLLKNRTTKKKKKVSTSKPLRFLSSDGLEIYVGKNNSQNDELSMRFADPLDLWFHTKDIPGSHVIVRTNGEFPPDKTVEEAGMIAAYYSKAKNSTLVAVDYTEIKNLKKPKGAQKGFVVYNTNYSLYVTPSETFIRKLMLETNESEENKSNEPV